MLMTVIRPLLLLVLLLDGCTSLPLPPLDRSVPPAWRHAVPQAAPTPDLKGWWQGFDDAALNALVDRALGQNLGLRAATERLRAARSLRARAAASYLPYLRAHTEDAINPSASASYEVSSFDAIWEIGLFGRREGTRRLLQAELLNEDAEMVGAEVSLVAEVVADYLMLGAGQQRLSLLSRMRMMYEQQLVLQKRRAELDLAPPFEVAEAESRVARAISAEASGRQQVDAMGAQLAVLLGLSAPESGWLDNDHVARLKLPGIPAAPAELLRTRPEIQRAEAAVLAAAGAAQLARADRMPSVGIGGSIRWSTSITSNRAAAPNFSIESIGPLLDIPLFDWGLRQSRAESRFHLLNAAALDYREAVLRGIAEVETALGALQRDTLREVQAEQVAEAMERGVNAVTRRTELQLANSLTTNSAALEALEGELALVDARAERGIAYVALYKALGGAPRPPPETP